VEQYIVLSEAATVFFVSFFEGKLYEMRIVYDDEKVSKVGGADNLVKRLVDKFGKPDHDSPGIIKKEPFEFRLNWTMTEANRRIIIMVKEETTRIDVLDIEVAKKMLDAKRKGADTGFDK
jgi:hypothetical protein